MMHTFTPLPFGGGVLLDTVTLAICECDEPEADLVARAQAGDDDPEVQRMVERLHDAGWQLGVQDRR
jgi:hypothetical protein